MFRSYVIITTLLVNLITLLFYGNLNRNELFEFIDFKKSLKRI